MNKLLLALEACRQRLGEYTTRLVNPTRIDPVRSLLICAALLVAAIGVATTLMIRQFRERALEAREGQLESTALLLARHFDQQLEDLQRVQKRLTLDISSAGVITPEEFRQRMSSRDVNAVLRSEISDPLFGHLTVLDADGKLINWSSSWPAPAVDLSDRVYFNAVKSSSDADSEFVEPIFSRLTNGPKALFARRLIGPNGAFLGAVTRAMDPRQFEEFFATVVLGKDMVISLFHSDGTLLARYPHIPSRVGQNFRSDPAFQRVKNRMGGGTLTLISPIDGEERIASIRKLRKFPLAVIVTATESAALADWRAQTCFLIGIATLFTIVVGCAVLLIVRQLSRQKKRLDTALNNMTQGLLLFDASQRVVVRNDRYIDIYGVSPDVIKPGCTLRDVITHRKEKGSVTGDVDEYCARVMRDMWSGKPFILELVDGRSIQIIDRAMPGGGWVSTHEDITERRRLDEQIAHLAHYDALTDLPNRVLLRSRLEEEIQRLSQGERFAVLYIDLDEFKGINDSLGHPVGDELLRIVAARLRGCVGPSDFVARLGGDEFAIVQTHVNSFDRIRDLVSRIHQTLREPCDCLGHWVLIEASIGISIAPDDGSNLDQLLKNADIAMYSAKADGRRTSRFFEPAMHERVKLRRTLERDLRQAITDGKFRENGFAVHYQPLVNLVTGAVTGCEALLRWRHPERGAISPADFIPVAEETGLINELGDWVLRTACAEASRWPTDVKLAVNVSPVQFGGATLALKVLSTLAASGLSPDRLELEITEAVLIRDDESALAILHQLRAIGVRIALDDFGTGYSSLSYLNRFPFDKIKIDRCFVAEIASSASIIKAVVDIAASRNMTTTAEGVETEQQRDQLRSLGCTEMQGFLVSAARPGDDILDMLATDSRRLSASN